MLYRVSMTLRSLSLYSLFMQPAYWCKNLVCIDVVCLQVLNKAKMVRDQRESLKARLQALQQK